MPSKTYKRLLDYIEHRMQMQHIYQPVMLDALLSNDGECPVSEIAKAFLALDSSQIGYYGEITKNMPARVLGGHGVVEKLKEGRRITGYRLSGFGDLNASEVASLRSACQSRLDSYLSKHGERIWSHRDKAIGYISGTIRYQVFKQAKYRCQLCGISAEQKALQVDHIIPRNKGGDDHISNFQALCFTCNAMKRDTDDTDFRTISESYKHRASDCIFCGIEKGRIIAENELCYAIRDGFPVTPLHTLIIPKRHVSDYFDLHQSELNAIQRMMAELKLEIESEDDEVTAFNVGINAGKEAGQTIFHCHIHLIPRRVGDTENPRGGVRGVIPSKQQY
ncbi:MAG: HIT domain-containing protein [Myxococcota bacterium]